jgi:hypothetical protein
MMDDAKINKRFGFGSFLTDDERKTGVEIAIIDGKLYHDITLKLNNLMCDSESKYVSFAHLGVHSLKTFYDLVRNKGPYDLINQPGWKRKFYVYNDMIIRNDVPGNLLYGYLGKTMGYPDHLLLAGAGFGQIMAGTFKWQWIPFSFGDDPQDQYWIDYGVRIYRSKHGTTTLDYAEDLFKAYL